MYWKPCISAPKRTRRTPIQSYVGVFCRWQASLPLGLLLARPPCSLSLFCFKGKWHLTLTSKPASNAAIRALPKAMALRLVNGGDVGAAVGRALMRQATAGWGGELMRQATAWLRANNN